MQIQTQGIIIKDVKTGESSRYVNILTKDKGVISAFAKGSRNLKSRLVSATSLLSYSDFTLYERNGKYYIDNAEVKKVFHSVQADIETLSLTMYFCDIVFHQGATEENAGMLLRLFLNSLHMLNEKKLSRDSVKFIFELRFMTLSGYMPNLLQCSGCGTAEEEVFYFDVTGGNIYCLACLSEEQKSHYIPFNKQELNAMRHVIYSDFEKLFSVKFSDTLANKLNKISEAFLIYHTDRAYKTLDFYKSLL